MPHRHQVKKFDPERIVPIAQAEGLGINDECFPEPERLVRGGDKMQANGPYGAGETWADSPRPSAWSDGTGLSGRASLT